MRAGLKLSLLGLVLLGAGCGGRRPSFLLVVVDALRADHLGCYGYGRDTSPALDSLAASGVLYTRAQAQAPWTLPAGASIVSGLSVRAHGVRQSTDGLFALPAEMPTAATLLSQAGYATTGQVNGYWMGAVFGFHRGFDSFSAYDNGHGRAKLAVDELIGRLEAMERERPFFAFLHLYDVHSPYHPPSEYGDIWQDSSSCGSHQWQADHEARLLLDPENRSRYVNLYDGEIRWTDAQLARLFSWLRSSGRETVVIVTADHGEEFLDHGWIEHGTTLYQEVLHVPLILSGPGVPAGVVDTTLVGQIDILPTLLELASEAAPDHLEGRPLLPPGSHSGRALPSGAAVPDHWHENGLRDRRWISVRRGDLKLIWDADSDSAAMYDLSLDPTELDPLPPDSSLLEEALRQWAAPRAFEPRRVEEPSGDQAEMLRNLGYI